MISTESRYLYVISSEVDVQHRDDVERWYQEDHIPALLRLPGFTRAQRLARLTDESSEVDSTEYLTFFELRSPAAVLDSCEYDAERARTSADEWAARWVRPYVTIRARGVYRETGSWTR